MQKVSDQAKLAFEEAFLHHKPVKMLVSLTRAAVKYATQVSKHVDCTYSHTVKVLAVFKKLGLVEFETKSREGKIISPKPFFQQHFSSKTFQAIYILQKLYLA